MVATIKVSTPCFNTADAMILERAAVGPEIWILVPPKRETTNPATIAV